MYYYKVSFLGRNLNALTYQSVEKIKPFQSVIAPLNHKPTQGYVIKECEKPEFKTLDIAEILPLFLTDMQALMAEFISYYYTCTLGVSLGLFEPMQKEAKALAKVENLKTPNLNQSQIDAQNFISENKNSLIFGDTGSGKSEIYISQIAKTLQNGKNALFLMPEISLTPQMQTRLEGYFGTSVAVWHSKITQKRKSEILQGLHDGKIRLVAGARSALFLPIQNLGVIVVDEEHDDSYKNGNSRPHYNARDLALFLSSKFDIKVILGSATPCATSFYKQKSFRLKGTFFNSQKSYIYDESPTTLSPLIKSEIAKSLSQKKQAIICLPTRANFKYLSCKSCGSTIKCPFCSVGMSYYKSKNLLKCQYCEYKMPVLKSCEKCGSDMIEARKIGTSELLEQLKNEFANAKIAKFDRDEITTQSKLVKALKEFNEGKIDILVGTQMLSKGHDYHNVDLAVIMGIDELLAYPDFRARERTLALAMQVAGRAGRAGVGRVVIQSMQRDFFEQFLNNYDAFLEDELTYREPLYPPFTRLLRLIISHKNEKIAVAELNSSLAKISNLQERLNFQTIGYGKCTLERIGDKFRYEILLRTNENTHVLAEVAKSCVSEICDVDIDPINFS
ncbi:primosomal protein N' [Campylobacter mucosalis]|uniref:primosomal protein N' n=1 Tax=Campylobacter mucosalis TaxID=202 RepID=UPI0014705FCE|nr:primosomal protein N' [Campylobacter mucosalis]